MTEVKVTQQMLDQLKGDTSPEAEALRQGGTPELKRQVELAMGQLEDERSTVPQLKKKYGGLQRARPSKLSMAVGFGIAYQRADNRMKN